VVAQKLVLVLLSSAEDASGQEFGALAAIQFLHELLLAIHRLERDVDVDSLRLVCFLVVVNFVQTFHDFLLELSDFFPVLLLFAFGCRLNILQSFHSLFLEPFLDFCVLFEVAVIRQAKVDAEHQVLIHVVMACRLVVHPDRRLRKDVLSPGIVNAW
jgi:hypothetical protein